MADYKNTLNLPNTKFPMRGNLVKNEPIILQRWNKQDLYRIVRNSKKGKKKFNLHDGPPYANGSIHIGHAVNKILKDIIIKFKGLMGYDSPFVPGWDCHGLPIELKVEQLIGKTNETISSSEFRKACRIYINKQVAEQKKDFMRLGILGDWKHSYLTADFIVEANIIRALSKVIDNGHLYKGTKPVHWCINCCSALAEAEVEYHDLISYAIDVAFIAVNIKKIIEIFDIANFSGIVSLVIWTTNPWTLAINKAIAVHPDFIYHLIKVNFQYLILAADLVKKFMQRIGINNWIVLGSVKGSSLEFFQFYHPFMMFYVSVVVSKHVTLETGTGAVHISPNHGIDDHLIGKKYGLKIDNLITPSGYFLPGTFPILDGLQIFNANTVVIDLLRNKNSLLCLDKIKHSYPHCWRHKTPTIFYATSQWFISMDQCNLRKNSLDAIEKIQWLPKRSELCIKNMITNRPDWCVSRQRIWGVPMALFVHKKTTKLHPNTINIMEEVAKRVEKNGIQAWWDLDSTEILGKDAINYYKVSDTLDVWFDSGTTHFTVMNQNSNNPNYSSDMYLEGLDQHRGWFMSSLITSISITGKVPYNQVITHGFIVDGNGQKMSKSLGNVIKPQKIINKLGADVLRLWTASVDYTSEMVISNEILKSSQNTYRRIRNTARFLLANLNDFNPLIHCVNQHKILILDRWAVGRAFIIQEKIINSYNNYNFHNVVRYITDFCSIELGSFYLDIIKDRQYTTKPNSIARRSCQTALYHIIEALVRWIMPIMSFTADEIWSFIPGKRAKYVFTEEWYDGLFKLDDQILNDNFWHVLQQLRKEVNKIIEQARINKYIGSSLEAHITLYAEPNFAAQLQKIGNELYFILLTSSVLVSNYIDAEEKAIPCETIKNLKIMLSKAKGSKCSRCWHYELSTGCNINYPDLCKRCITNIIGSGEVRYFA